MILLFGVFISLLLVAYSEIISPTNELENDSRQRTIDNFNLKVKLSSSPSEIDAPTIPLVGLGVANLPHNRIPFLLATAMDSKPKNDDLGIHYTLIDTSRTNPALEVLVGRSLGRLLSSGGGANSKEDYHVIIKIWHTHLGYDRTIMSVHDSLSDILPGMFSSKDPSDPASWKKDHRVKFHAVLQYPKCYDDLFTSNYYQTSPNFPVKYSNCREEEEAFARSSSLRDPSPLEDKMAWMRSYRALEELYERDILESIGVSNFGPEDMSSLFSYATIGPHIYMGTLHTLVEREEMVEEMVKHGVHYICYDAVSAMLEGKSEAESAYATLERLGARHGMKLNEGDSNGFSAVQIVLGWLVQRGIGVLPGTTDSRHLIDNSPQMLSLMPKFSPKEQLSIEMAVEALLHGDDMEEEEGKVDTKNEHGDFMKTDNESAEEASTVVATFFNSLKNSVRIFRVHPTTGRQIQLSSSIAPGRNGRIMVELNDVLIAYDGHGTAVKKFLVETDEGVGRVDFSVEL